MCFVICIPIIYMYILSFAFHKTRSVHPMSFLGTPGFFILCRQVVKAYICTDMCVYVYHSHAGKSQCFFFLFSLSFFPNHPYSVNKLAQLKGILPWVFLHSRASSRRGVSACRITRPNRPKSSEYNCNVQHNPVSTDHFPPTSLYTYRRHESWPV